MEEDFTKRRLQRRLLRTAVLASVDVIGIYTAFVLGFVIREAYPKPMAHHVSLLSFCVFAVAAVPLWVTIFAGCGLYSARQSDRRSAFFGRVVVSVVLGVMVLIVVDYLMTQVQLFPSHAVPLIALVAGVVLLLGGRLLVLLAMRPVYARNRGIHHIVLIGADELAERLSAELRRLPANRVVAAVSPSADGRWLSGNVPVFATLQQALDVQNIRVDEIVQADSKLPRDEIVQLMAQAHARGIGYRFVPDMFGIYASSATVSTIGGVPVMEVRLTSLDGWATVVKRLVDIVGAFVGLVLLAPLMLGVALAVKLHDPEGPVLYRQRRLGRGGVPISLFKFRSMMWKYSTGVDRPFQTAQQAFIALGRADLVEEFNAKQKVDDDPRVSRLGVFLRRTSLDELPQLFNALLGHVSLVGPRPIVLEELERYGEHRHSFLALKPGITGLWQVSGRSDLGYEQRVQLDMAYVENWSHLLDLVILARTVRTVAARRGAY